MAIPQQGGRSASRKIGSAEVSSESESTVDPKTPSSKRGLGELGMAGTVMPRRICTTDRDHPVQSDSPVQIKCCFAFSMK